MSAVNLSIISWFSMGWQPRWPMGHGSHGSWVKSWVGHLSHGSLWVTHSLLCTNVRDRTDATTVHSR